MAGHSKWKNIRHKKNKQDARKGKIFTKIIRELTVAGSQGGSDPASNSRLRAAIQTALSENMTRETIDRAIERGSGIENNTQLEETRYEGYAPSGIAVMIECMTDNRNRTAGEIRHAFSKCGGNLGAEGSVSYLFAKRGVIQLPKEAPGDAIIELALEAGAQDVLQHESGDYTVYTAPESFSDIHDRFSQASFPITQAEISQIPGNFIQIAEVETAKKILKLIDMLEDLDDVQHVYTNLEIADDIADQLE